MSLTFLQVLLRGHFEWCHWIFSEGSPFLPLLPLQCWYQLQLQVYQIALCWEKGEAPLQRQCSSLGRCQQCAQLSFPLPSSTEKEGSHQQWYKHLEAEEARVRRSFQSQVWKHTALPAKPRSQKPEYQC